MLDIMHYQRTVHVRIQSVISTK